MSQKLKDALKLISMELEFIQKDVEHIYFLSKPILRDNDQESNDKKEINKFDWLRGEIDRLEKSNCEIDCVSIQAQYKEVGISDGAWKREPTGKCLLKVFYTMPKGG